MTTQAYQGKCDQCEQMFGQYDRFCVDAEVELKPSRFKKINGEKVPDGNECFPCEARTGYPEKGGDTNGEREHQRKNRMDHG